MHLYIHIPFCRKACHYCDFHFSTNLNMKAEMAAAICKEIELQAGYLSQKHLETIYFGGGTPSLLSPQELGDIFDTIKKYYTIADDAEITLEANPDDISQPLLKNLQALGFNRLSIGIQSFYPDHLLKLNRIHNASEAENSVKLAQDMGFENLTIDLIYAIPSESHAIWLNDLEKALALNVPHISSYCLTIEEKTVFGKWLKLNKIPPINEDFASEQFRILVDTLETAGYEQYEISNFCRNGRYSRHNSSYWKRHEYLGVGPSAHSYNGVSRQYNIANNAAYLRAIQTGTVPAEYELLSKADQLNDYLLTGLRTKWGCAIAEINKLAGNNWQQTNRYTLDKYLTQQMLTIENETLTLTKAGKLFADRIASDLFMV
ncbi:radical SAM family heme chaperone HemW [Emticicia sp. TH156]|uniref:radical SAM family heme chaperone HemW n=1 Tax=Emticicia sp. TH156 TaxID=2067454 RepID=UPI000C78AAE1|nr:radical SAM family heme chaperone HemW [Emticicia sp. TH156]PLK44588.1 coproporphyrinogen III oxidase [Emticicia sp. TH156]